MIINRLSEIMGRKRLKIADVVAGTGLAINTVSGLYHDKVKRVDLETLDKLCLFLDVGVGDILEYHREQDQG
ncbi:helix-turn-helix domain-containing protein [Paenibacillus naphthalenovorans]|uniref:helix-turn-helix domain-containing protein n=1 Tax=Paenibacillus naphthalenovorans TaxID=162209 RepID=UPI00088F6C43|nr:helix-turn-helix transcriptional regulator [Paenibacillus naphthalenovorans]SDJ93230.1 putative transcriptional regulator [Paenibacillus naphthalenovorans]